MYGIEYGDRVSSAKVICASMGPTGVPLFTLRLRYPRIIHAELMTHRMLTKSTASSRAIPTSVMLEILEEDPARFVSWGKNKSGMSSIEDIGEQESTLADLLWSMLRKHTMETVRALHGLKVHKQLANRPLEPFSKITCVISGTEWSNFEALRVNPDAQPEFHNLARQIRDVLRDTIFDRLDDGAYHLPFVTNAPDEAELRKLSVQDQIACSVARCARETYGKSLDQKSAKDELRVYNDLLRAGHMAPFEHVGQACTKERWESAARAAAEEWVLRRVPVGNFWGWLQHRKTITFEHDFSLRQAA